MQTTQRAGSSPFVALTAIAATGLIVGVLAFLIGITSWEQYPGEFTRAWGLLIAGWSFPIGVLATLLALTVAALSEDARWPRAVSDTVAIEDWIARRDAAKD